MHFNAIALCENFVQAKKSRFLVEEEAAAAEQAVKAIVEYTDKAHGEWKACEEKTCKNYSSSNNTAAAGKKVCLEKKLKTLEHIHTHIHAKRINIHTHTVT